MKIESQLKSLYFKTLRIRLIELAIARRYNEQLMRCPVHLSVGQEAIATGVCHYLSSNDFMMSTHRAHAHYLAKGGNFKAMLAEIHAKQTGCCEGRGGSMHLIDKSANFLGATPIVGGAFPLSVGVAFASKLKKENRITVAFHGEAMTEEGVFAEALNFAALKELPVLFVCETNLYSVYSPMEVRQPKNRDLCEIARAHGIHAQKGDGNKIDEVLKLSKYAIDEIRKNKQPQFIEFSTYRWLEHCGPSYDLDLGYRTEEELKCWKEKCPLKYFEALLKNTGSLEDKEIEEATKAFENEIGDAFTYAINSPSPAKSELMRHIYA